MTKKHDDARIASAEHFASGVERAAAGLRSGDPLQGEAAFLAAAVRDRGAAPSKNEVIRLRAMHQRGMTAKQAVSRLNQGLS